MDLAHSIKTQARALGFDLVAITSVGPSPDWERYRAWLEAGRAGEMDFLMRHLPLKRDPRTLLPDARSMILVGLNYAAHLDPELLENPARGRISMYALGSDYHKIMRKALIRLDRWLAQRIGRSTQGRIFVDSAPVLERSWANRGGLGFIGKNTCLIHPRMGSYFFLGGLLVPEALPPDPTPRLETAWRTFQKDVVWRFEDGQIGTCGACTRCLKRCPTHALVGPRELDARLCIAYLTIEHRGVIPATIRPQMGNWVFGCDICQDVCPWNRKRHIAQHPKLQPHPDRIAPPLLELLALDEDAFRQRFAGSPVMRAKWMGFMRNVCIAAGNWGDPEALEGLAHHLWHSPPLVAIHAAWALAQLRHEAGVPVLEQAAKSTKKPHLREIIAQARR